MDTGLAAISDGNDRLQRELPKKYSLPCQAGDRTPACQGSQFRKRASQEQVQKTAKNHPHSIKGKLEFRILGSKSECPSVEPCHFNEPACKQPNIELKPKITETQHWINYLSVSGSAPCPKPRMHLQGFLPASSTPSLNHCLFTARRIFSKNLRLTCAFNLTVNGRLSVGSIQRRHLIAHFHQFRRDLYQCSQAY